MRDLLPDLLNGTLDAGARAEVEAHVASCADCRAELDMLRAIRRAAPQPAVNVARIVSALPAPAQPGARRRGWAR
ncbi:MAG TPA: zf-HC2 domain-containing protein, partial [Gemmatimonadaceae bacterium]|nr:zf-HC2 domain-containing protein [Gemmatimonadaceae bacterium]